MKSLAAFLVLIVFSTAATAINTDSLRTVLAGQQGVPRILTLCELATALPSKESEEAVRLAREAVNLSVEASVDTLIVKSNAALGAVYEKKHLYPEAIAALKEALRVAERVGDKKKIGVICTNIGRNIFTYNVNRKEAMEYYFRAIELYQQIGEKERMARTYVNIANMMSSQGDNDGALNYYKMALPVIRDSSALAGIYNNIGAVYYQKGDLRTSFEWLEKALGVKQRNGFDEEEIADSYNNLGSVLINLGQEDKAMEYLRKALAINLSSGDSGSIAMNKNNIGSLYMNTGRLTEAEVYLLEAARISEKENIRGLTKDVYGLLAKLYALKNDFRAAYGYQKKFLELQESMQTSDLRQQISAAEQRINAQLREQEAKEKELQRQKENELLQVRNERQNLFIGILVAGALALLAAAGLFLLRYREKKRANEQLENRNLTIEAQKFEIEVKNREITDSIRYAQRLQQALLPQEDNLKESFPDSFVLFLPRDIVSGDFFWCATTGGKTIVAVADCTGHGVPGALMSMIGNNLLHQAVYEKQVSDPAQLLAELNRGLADLLQQRSGITSGEALGVKDGMDICLCVIDMARNELNYAGANRLLLIIRNREMTELPSDRASIGGNTPYDFVFTCRRFGLQPGDCLYLFTDGYADQFGGDKGKKMLSRNMKQVLLEHSSHPMEKQKDLLASHFHEWKGDYGQVDDVLLAGVRIG